MLRNLILAGCLTLTGQSLQAQPISAQEVLSYWFPEEGPDMQLWFGADPATDAEIRTLFSEAVDLAYYGELDHWKNDPRGRLALIILLDQFPRNIFRDTPEMYAYDELAVALALEGVELGTDRELSESERLFFYLPFEHAEDLISQDLAVACVGQLGNPVWLDYAERHRAVIARFGHFPHRNAILDRPSTTEELEFLQNGRF